MDNVAASDAGSALGALAWLILLVAVLLSSVLALVSRRLYVAAVIRLQGHSKVRPNDSASAVTVPSSLRIVIDDLADRKGPSADIALLKLRRRLLVLQALGDIVFWGGFLLLAFFGAALMQAVGHLARTGESDLFFTVLRMMTLAFDGDFSLSGIWVTAVFIVGWLVVPPLVLCLGQTAARRSHVYIPVAVFATGSLMETWRVTLSSGPVLLMMAIGVIGIAVVMLRDPRVRGAASPLVVALATGLSACTVPVLLVEEWAGSATDVEVPFSATVALVQMAFLLVIAVAVLAVLYGLAYLSAKALQRRAACECRVLASDLARSGRDGCLRVERKPYSRLGSSDGRPACLGVRDRVRRQQMAPAPDTQESTGCRRPSHPARFQAGGPIRDVHRSTLVVLAVRCSGPPDCRT